MKPVGFFSHKIMEGKTEASLTEIRKDQINTGLFVKDRITGLPSSEQLIPTDCKLLMSLLMGLAANPLSSQLARGERPL